MEITVHYITPAGRMVFYLPAIAL